MRSLIDLACRMRRLAMRVLKWRTTGVKVMVFDPGGAMLLVRHRYGNSAMWMLPGGGVARGESPAAAAAREMMEEVGCALRDLAPIATYWSAAEGRRDTVHLFRATTRDLAIADGVELAEARFFALDALPDTVSPATMRRINEWIGQRSRTEEW